MKRIIDVLESCQALLFDLDGTLADTTVIHNNAWIQALEESGCKLDPRVLAELSGVPNLKTVEIFNQRFGWTLRPSDLVHRKESLYLQHLHEVTAVETVFSLARSFAAQSKPMGLVTGSSRSIAEKTLIALQIEELFKVKVCAEDYQKGKPDPEPYLMGAAKLGVPPERCVVFEDSQAGIQSAQAAGMVVVPVNDDGSFGEIM